MIVIYTENEFKRYVKNVYNVFFQSSVKDISLSFCNRFMEIKSKHRFNSSSKDRPVYVEIFREDKFDKIIENLLKRKFDDFTIEIKNTILVVNYF